MMLLQGCADDGQAVPYRDLLLADNVVFYRDTHDKVCNGIIAECP